MEKTTFFLALALSSGLLFTGCIEPSVDIPEQVAGLAPIYYEGDWRDIGAEPPQPIRELFKIYYKDSIIFAGESLKGIHVIDNTDPFYPETIKFIRIPGNSDIAIKGNTLYANNLSDLVAIDIGNLDDIRVLDRVRNAFPGGGSPLPDNYFGFFECPDTSMGAVVGWAEKVLERPECWR
ncbi:MAG: hypothetical protein J5I94_18055 [Phaeodactylibacter sp.]|nr:hypothetical protein [Phaeodactylibacter sp.]